MLGTSPSAAWEEELGVEIGFLNPISTPKNPLESHKVHFVQVIRNEIFLHRIFELAVRNIWE